MKWIGQNIYDQISKFRNTVDFSKDVTFYQPVNDADPSISIGSSDDERLKISVNYQGTTTQTAQVASFQTLTESGTAHDGKFVFGVDGVNILNIDDGGIDFRVGKGISINGRDVIVDDVSTPVGFISLSVDSIASESLVVLSDTVTFQSGNADDPLITIKNTSNAANDMARLNFVKDRGAAPAIGDNLAEIRFMGEDSGQNEQEYGRIFCETDVVTDGQESGKLSFGVANHDGGVGYGLTLTGGSADNEIDVTVGLGAASVTTIAGTLTCAPGISADVTGDLTGQADTVATIAGLAPNTATTQATQAAITTCANLVTVGTIGDGEWRGTAIAHAYIGADAIEGDNIADDAVDSEHYTDGSIDTAHIADDQVTFAKAQGVTPNVFNNKIKLIPSDFMANDDGGNTKFGVGYVETAGAGYGMRVANNATELYAFVSIPQGMTATHVDIFDKNDLAIEVFEAQINATTMTSKGSGNANTTLDITDVASTATNFLAIQVTTTSATNDKIYGGTVTIA